MGSFLNEGPFLGPFLFFIRVPYYMGYPKRGPNSET